MSAALRLERAVPRLTLLSLVACNFKGDDGSALETGGGDVGIYGDNGTGKTTKADAWFWLLFGKDSRDRANFTIKPMGPDGKPRQKGVTTSVEGSLVLPDGKALTLKKEYAEKWVKPNGAAKSEMSGHSTQHYVNGVPCSESEYKRAVAEVCDEKRFRELTDPFHFVDTVEWKTRRTRLVEMAGDVTDADVIAADPDLKELPRLLDGRSVEDRKKMAHAAKKEVDDRREELPARIDEANRLAQVTDDVPDVDAEKLRAEIRALNEERARAASGGGVAEAMVNKRKAEAALQEAVTRLKAHKDEATAALARDVVNKRLALDAANAELAACKRRGAALKDEIEAIDKRLEGLRAEWAEIAARTFADPVAGSCAACGQPLPEDRVQEAREKALEAFNLKQSKDKEANQAAGKRLKADRDAASESFEAERAKSGDLTAAVEVAGAALKEADQAVADAESSYVPDQALADAVATAQHDVDMYALEAERLGADSSAAVTAVEERIRQAEAALREAETAAARVRLAQESADRVKQLEDEESRLAGESEKLALTLHLCEVFVRAKARMLTERIDAMFRITKWRLFEDQVNGGVNEVCEPMSLNDAGALVPFRDLNHGRRLNVGLDVIDALASHAGFAPPIFVDNAESVTAIAKTYGQQVRLVVSEPDKRLRTEKETA